MLRMRFLSVSRLVIGAALVALTTACPSASRASTILLSDDFSGSSLDSSKWTTNLPLSDSSVAVSDGCALLTARGYLVSAKQYNPDAYSGITITGKWKTNDYRDEWSVLTRTTGVGNPGYFGEAFSGLEFKFWDDNGTGAALQILADGSAISVTNVQTTGSLKSIANAWYTFTVVDNGTKGLSFTMAQVGDSTNTATVTATLVSDTSTANYIAFHNREWPTSSLDDVSVSGAVPEPSSTAMTIVGAAGLLAFAWRKRRVR